MSRVGGVGGGSCALSERLSRHGRKVAVKSGAATDGSLSEIDGGAFEAWTGLGPRKVRENIAAGKLH